MGFFDKFKKDKINHEEIKIEVTEKNRKLIEPNIITDSVNEKYLSYAEDIIPSLISFLRRLDDVEEKTFTLSRNKGDDYDLFREEYALFKEEYGRIASELCTKELLDRGYLGSFGKPTKYGHINKGCDLEFVMKSTKQASAILYNDRNKSYLYTYRFVFKNIDDIWKVYSVSCRLGDDDSWHIDNI